MPLPISKLMLACLLSFLWSLPASGTITIGPWQPMFKGVDFTTGQADSSEPHLQKVAALRIDLNDPDIEFFSTPSNGDAPLETFGQTTTSFVQSYGVAVGVNANFFSPVNTTPNDPRELDGLAISRGEVVSPGASGRPTVLVTRSNAVSFGTATPSGLASYWAAVAGSHRLVRDGTNSADPTCTTSFCGLNPRTAVGLSQDKRYFYMLVIDGRQAGWSEGATLVETADWLLRFGAHDGLNLDGGGSSAMAQLTNGTAVLLNRPSGGVQRVNGNHLGVFALPLELAPKIVSQPVGQTVAEWDSVQFTVSATSSKPLTYQWRFEGSNIPSANASSYSISGVQVANAGNYSVRVSNADAFVTSSNALLSVTPQRTRIIGRGDDSLGQVQVSPAATNLLALSAGGYHSLALRADGRVLAWGNNSLGQAIVPVSATNISALSAGGYHNLGINREGRVVAWGANTEGQCNVPVGVEDVWAVAAGGRHSLALLRAGTVGAWGDNTFGQANVPDGVTDAVGIAAGQSHSLAVLTDGHVVGWGANINEFGLYSGQSLVPPTLSNVVAVAAGGAHSLALRSDGTVAGWGDNSHGQAMPPPGLSNVVAIAAGAGHSVALRNNGVLVAWGDNSSGQGTFPPTATNFVAIAAGSYHTLGLLHEATIPPLLFAPRLNQTVFSALSSSFARSRYHLQCRRGSEAAWGPVSILPGNGALILLADPAATNSNAIYRILRED